MEVEVIYKDESYDITLILSSAKVSDAIKRTGLQSAIEHPEDSSALIAYMTIYPSCLATPTTVENRGEKEFSLDMTLEDFLSLPDSLVSMWSDAVFEVNPHWSIAGIQAILNDEEVLEYNGNVISIGQATFANGIKRTGLQRKYWETHKEAAADMFALLLMYPSCVSAPGAPADFTAEQFLELEDEFATRWAYKVWEVNPHWSPFGKPSQVLSS